MKRKPKLEADLDPAGTRHTRPGGTAAQRAVESTKRRTSGTRKRGEPMRPGGAAALRVVEEVDRKMKAKKRKVGR